MRPGLETAMSKLIDLINRREFAGVEMMVDDDCVLDLPGGSRIIGRESLRNSLAAYLLQGDVQFADSVFMSDATQQRGAAEVTLKNNGLSTSAVLVVERDNDLIVRISLYGS